MCALFGWLDYRGIVSDKLLKKLTQALANAAEERGTDASGIAYVKGGKVTIYKRPKPAHKLRFNAPNNTRAVMGHTRMTTQGNEKFNYNNHPFYGHADVDFAFAHNGVLYNDKELRMEKHLPNTQIETDSYIAVQLLEQQGKLNFDSLKSMAESVQGSFCFTALDENNTLYIIKGSNPMCLLHFAQLGLYIYASTESILKKALQKSGFHKYRFEVLNVDEGTILKIDRYGFLTCSTFEVQENFRFGKWYNWYDELEEEYYTQQEELLLEMCGCYGVTEEDILLLLDYGYSAGEIEEMLCDSNLLLETINAVQSEEIFAQQYLQEEPFQKVYFLGRFLFSRKPVPKSPFLTFETFQKRQDFLRQFRGVFMDNRTFGYARVSSREQHEDRQIEALTNYGVNRDNIIVDKCSGKDTEREGYQYLKKQMLRNGDTLVIKELDRLSRSKSDIKQELEFFKCNGIHVKILDIPTTLTDFPPEQMWVMDMINAILIEVLGSIAENERLKIRRRQREGIDAAKKKDIKFGRPTLELPENLEIVMQAVEAKQITVSQALGQLHISRSSYYRLKQHQ